RRPTPRHRQLGARPLSLLEPRPELARPRAGATALLQHAVARRLGLRQLRGPLGQLLEPLPEVLAVARDHFELRVEQREHRGILGPERALAGRARALGSELDDVIALLLHLFVQLEELGALGLGVLAVLHPGRPLRFGRALGRLDALAAPPTRSSAAPRGPARLSRRAARRPRPAPSPGPARDRPRWSAAPPPALRRPGVRLRDRAPPRPRRFARRVPAPARRAGARTRARATERPRAQSCRAPPSPPAPSGR